MDNVTFIEQPQIDNSMMAYAIIDRGNGEFTSMTKADYDAQIAANQTLPSELSTPTTPQAGE